jgi:peptidoglycan/LPS O-acetylase OafA/YrhL
MGMLSTTNLVSRDNRWRVNQLATGNRSAEISDLLPVRLIGLVTFPLYLTHIHVGGLILVALTRAGVPAPIGIAGATAFSLAAAYAIVRFAEPAFHAQVSRFFDSLFTRGTSSAS